MPAEYFSLMVLGLLGAVVLAHGSLLKAIAMIVLGLLLGIVGTDVNSGVTRFAFGIPELSDGIGVVSVAMGLFGFAEIITNLEGQEKRDVIAAKVKGLWLTREQFREAWPAVLRGTGLGSVLGLLPGGGAMLASFAVLRAGEEGREGSEPLRQGRDPGRRRPGVREQRRRADVVHSAADARHPGKRGDGADGRRDDDPQHPARAAGDDEQSRRSSGASSRRCGSAT